MSAIPAVLHQLVDDPGLLVPGCAVDRVVAEHQPRRQTEWGQLFGELVVSDTRLAELSRCAEINKQGPDHPLPVCVVNTTGAGGLVALAGRRVPGLEVVAVESALRDLDDLCGNAARVIAAAAALPESTTVYVEIPVAPDWTDAVEQVEAAGLCGAVRTHEWEGWAGLLHRLSVLVEADLPFKVTGWDDSVVGLLFAVDALVVGFTPQEAALYLNRPGGAGDVRPSQCIGSMASWDSSSAARVRRRLRRVQGPAVSHVVDELLQALPQPPASGAVSGA